MDNPDTIALGESLHRLAKLALDTGEVDTVEAALDLFRGYNLHIVAGSGMAGSAARQAALLTAVNCASRTFLGGVTVEGDLNVPLEIPFPGFADLADAVRTFGGRRVGCAPATGVRLSLAGARADAGLHLVMQSWCAAVVPADVADADDDPDAFILAGVAGAALAVAELFQMVRGSNPAAGRRIVGLSLWSGRGDWLHRGADGIRPRNLPAAAWLIGLGNLGQAYLWSLAMLPYARPQDVRLVLQDFDRVAESNLSTSLLTVPAMLGRYKARTMAAWAEQLGFDTRIVERRFDRTLIVGPEDPSIALCGVDNAHARAALEDVGFARIFEAGLGSGPSDFLGLRLHSFPGPRRSREIWGDSGARLRLPLDMPAYRALADSGADQCGLASLAGRTVGAPFVGALAGVLVIAELVRLANGGPISALLDLHLRSPERRGIYPQAADFGWNPGITEARA